MEFYYSEGIKVCLASAVFGVPIGYKVIEIEATESPHPIEENQIPIYPNSVQPIYAVNTNNGPNSLIDPRIGLVLPE
jgi:hypothetical protein